MVPSNAAGKVKAYHRSLQVSNVSRVSSCSPINANQILGCQRNFEDENFADDNLTAKTAKFTSLENLYVYGT